MTKKQIENLYQIYKNAKIMTELESTKENQSCLNIVIDMLKELDLHIDFYNRYNAADYRIDIHKIERIEKLISKGFLHGKRIGIAAKDYHIYLEELDYCYNLTSEEKEELFTLASEVYKHTKTIEGYRENLQRKLSDMINN